MLGADSLAAEPGFKGPGGMINRVLVLCDSYFKLWDDSHRSQKDVCMEEWGSWRRLVRAIIISNLEMGKLRFKEGK